MPLPLSHTLAGATLYTVLDEDGGAAGWRRAALAVMLANAADLDLLPGMAIGEPNRFHRMATHAVPVVIVVAIVAGWAAWWAWRAAWPLRRGLGRGAAATALMVGSLWGSHVVLDLFTADPSPPRGVQAMWPLSDGWVHAYPLFERTDRISGQASVAEFLASLASWHNVRATLFELLILGPVLVAAQWSRRRRRGT